MAVAFVEDGDVFAFVGGAVAYRSGSHSSVNVVHNVLSSRHQAALSIALDLLVLFVSIAVAQTALELVNTQWDQTTQVLELPVAILSLPFLIGMLLVAVFAFERLALQGPVALALALVLALRTLRGIAGPGKRDAVDRALKKLEAAAGNMPATDQATVAVTAARDDIQARVNDGLQRGKRLDLTYDVASRAETTRRMVDPLRVFVLDGYGYLEAWCYSARALRTFRLDRIAAVEVTPVEVAPHDVQLKDLSTGWFEALKDAPLVTLEVQPSAAWIAEYYPTEAVTTRPGGGLIVSLHVTDPAWLRSLLLRLQGGARVLSPEGAGDSAAEAAREALDQYAVLLGTNAV